MPTPAQMMLMASKAPAAGGVSITDSFNRASSATIMGNTDTGETWTVLSGTWGISSNTAYCSVAGVGQSHVVVDSGVSDCTITVTMSALDDGGLCFRAIDDNNLFVMAANAGAAIVYRRTSGGFTAIMSPATTFTAGDVTQIVLSGTSIVWNKNGSLIASTTDSQGLTATQHGLRSYFNGTRFDDFSITA